MKSTLNTAGRRRATNSSAALRFVAVLGVLAVFSSCSGFDDFRAYGPTPVHTATLDLPALNWALTRAVGAIRETVDKAGRQVSNVGGWQSHSNLFDYVEHLRGPAPKLSSALKTANMAAGALAKAC